MSWLFSQALVAEYSEAICSDGEPSAQLSVMPTQHKFWRNDKTMEFCDLSRFGLTCAVLTEDRGMELLTLYLADFPVRTLALPGVVTDLMEIDRDCGTKWRGSFVKWDQSSLKWKTHQYSLLGGLDEFSETWPQWGLMRNGECLEQTPLDLTSEESECGLLPTVLATDWKGGTTSARKDNGKQRFDQWRDYIKIKFGMKYPHPTHSEIRMGWPIGWTDLKPLEMGRFQEWQQLHSLFDQEQP